MGIAPKQPNKKRKEKRKRNGIKESRVSDPKGPTMNNKKNYKKGTRLDIIETIHMTSILPVKGLDVVDTPRTYKDKLKEMKQETILNEFRVNNKGQTYRVFGLNNYEKNRSEYSEFLKDGFYENFVYYAQQLARNCKNMPGGPSMRVITCSETYMMMKHAGVACDPYNRPNLLQNILLDDHMNTYYSSREIKSYSDYKVDFKTIKGKNMTNDTVKLLISSRITGFLLSYSGAYAVYNLGRSITNWQRGGELKMKTYLDYMLANKLEKPMMCESALLTLENYESLSKAITPLNKKDMVASSSFDNLKVSYKNIYAIPYNLDGRHMLEIMLQPNWIKELKDTFLSNFTMVDTDIKPMPYDAYTDDEYILLFCVPDIRKLQTFTRYAENTNDKNKFIILCFDFQVEMLAMSSSAVCRIQKTSFQNFYYQYMKNKRDKAR